MEQVLFLGLNIFAWITILLLVFKFIMLYTGKLPSDVVSFICVATLLITGTLTEEQGLAGFGSNPVVTLGVLFILIAGLIHSGVVQWVVNHIMGEPKSEKKAFLRLMFPVAAISSILNNAAVTILFLNVVKTWAKRIKVAPSKLLIPLSYASMIGGTLTVLGSPSNLIIADIYKTDTGEFMPLLAPTLPALCCLLICICATVYMRKRIPVRKAPEESFESRAEYTVEFLVPSENEAVGMTLEEANLQNVHGGHLIEIVRFDREVISPVPADEFILGGDRLVYSGHIQDLLNLRDSRELVSATHHVYSSDEVMKNRKLQMATVVRGGRLEGRRMVDFDFEDKNGVVLVAVAREGERIAGMPREIELHAGDTLLLEGEKLNPMNFSENLIFFDNIALPQESMKTLLASGIILLMVILSFLDILSLLNSCLVAALLMFACRCCSIEQVRDLLNFKLLLVFVGSYCLGKAVDASGIAAMIADAIMYFSGTNALVGFIMLCVVANLVTEVTTNAATAAFFAPVALKMSLELGSNPLTFCIGLMIAISCSFSTPVGSDTNLLVYGPGGYKSTDFLRIGIPMDLLLLAANIFFVSLFFPL